MSSKQRWKNNWILRLSSFKSLSLMLPKRTAFVEHVMRCLGGKGLSSLLASSAKTLWRNKMNHWGFDVVLSWRQPPTAEPLNGPTPVQWHFQMMYVPSRRAHRVVWVFISLLPTQIFQLHSFLNKMFYFLILFAHLKPFHLFSNKGFSCVSGGRDARGRDWYWWLAGGQQWWWESQQTTGKCVCVCGCVCIQVFSRDDWSQSEWEILYRDVVVDWFLSCLDIQ